MGNEGSESDDSEGDAAATASPPRAAAFICGCAAAVATNGREVDGDVGARRLLEAVDPRTREFLERRKGVTKGRGWLLRRLLLAADIVALTLAFLLAVVLTQGSGADTWVGRDLPRDPAALGDRGQALSVVRP